MSRCVLLVVLALLAANTCGLELNLTDFTQFLTDIANDNLGVNTMQNEYNSFQYTTNPRDAMKIAEELALQTSILFDTQKLALQRLKTEIEKIYDGRFFLSQNSDHQCCNLENLTSDYEFREPISRDHSCNRVSGVADISAPSLYSRLDTIYKSNDQAPLKWQYFGSEFGVTNQYPAGKAPDCDGYDNRFRPWYIASATPNPKDVVLVVKNNKFLTPESQERLFEAADIILRTLNPRDRVAVVVYNHDVMRPAIDGCYATNLSLATPANIRKFQYFLQTAPDPQDGNNMTLALETAYHYFNGDSNIHTERERAIILFTDGERIDSSEEKQEIEDIVRHYANVTDLNITLFIFTATSREAPVTQDVRSFLTQLVTIASGDSTVRYYIELPSQGDLRKNMADFYSLFATTSQQTDEFSPVFMVPYYDIFGLDQLVITISTPCYMDDLGAPQLVGVAAVDLTVSDLLAGVEYFSEGELSYAFVIDQEGLVLFHPLLPFPSSNDSAVYLDISTLEPQPGFQEVRESMISGGLGCMDMNATQVFSRGSSTHEGATTVMIQSKYCWTQIEGTPFSLCVVIPVNSDLTTVRSDSFQTPINAHYHRLDVLAEEEELCSYHSFKATREYSTVSFSPEAFARPDTYLLSEETEETVQYIQESISQLTDRKQMFRSGILNSVATTSKVDDIWLTTDREYFTWRYIAPGSGAFRIYPGIQLTNKAFDAVQRPWYQHAVEHLGLISILPSYLDGLGAGPVMTLSQAIVPVGCDVCDHGVDVGDPSCPVLAVMGIDFTHAYFSQLLHTSVPLCSDTEHFRCLIIDSSAYLVTHPDFLNNPDDNIVHKHLAELEPLVAMDMVAMGYLRRSYCNNFQYNSDFTKRPRKQYSYEITEQVAVSVEPMSGGYRTYCTFYTIAPVVGTNTFLIVVDVQRSSRSLCTSITCPCNPDQSCSSLPADCMCPCSEDIPPSNYNACLESFDGLSAPACPTRFGLNDVQGSVNGLQAHDSSLPVCYEPHCEGRATYLECLSVPECDYCVHNHSNGTLLGVCKVKGSCLISNDTDLTTGTEVQTSSSSSDDVEVWQTIAGVFLVIATVATIVLMVLVAVYLRERTRRKYQYAASTSQQSVSDQKGLHAHNVVELETLSGTSKDTCSTRVRDPPIQDTHPAELQALGHIPESSETSDDEQNTQESLETRGFSDIFRTGQGSLNPSHAGGIWF